MELGRRGFYIRYTAWLTMIVALLGLLFGRGFGLYSFDMSEFLIAIILMGSGLMIFLETSFTKDMDWVDSTSLNFLIGFPSALIASTLGIGYLLSVQFIVDGFQSFEGGIYLTAIIILIYQGITALMDFDPDIDDFRKD